jgi:predicted ATP-grasp superfamily ATP-dependent carboligase
MRVLLSEGASTSAREAITALGLDGHSIEICDPDPHCIGRFSRFVRRFHRCPGLGADPEQYFTFMVDLLRSGRFDVLLPIHEQGFLFAAMREHIPAGIGLALPRFESYRRIHDKVSFSKVLTDLGLPQPRTRFVTGRHDLSRIGDFPFVLKAAIGTASRGTWMVETTADLTDAIRELDRSDGFDLPVLVQARAAGDVEHAQSVFLDGALVGFHAYRQVARGAGGGDAIKESIDRPLVREHLARLGRHLDWSGALSVDYIQGPAPAPPLYIDGNPRLVEPMSARFAGTDLAGMLLRVSTGEALPAAAPGRPGVRTHIAVQALLGCALRSGSRFEVLRECWRLMAKRAPYAGSREELTPLRLDAPSVIAAIVTALWLLVQPQAARTLPTRGWGAHLLTPRSVRTITAMRAQSREQPLPAGAR